MSSSSSNGDGGYGDSGDEEGNKAVIVGAAVALTLTILRAAMDMVQVAGISDANSGKDKKKEKDESKDVEKKGNNTNSYGSVEAGGGGDGGATSSSGGAGEENEPLLLGDSSALPSNNNNNNNDRCRTRFFAACWSLLTCLFVALTLWSTVFSAASNDDVAVVDVGGQREQHHVPAYYNAVPWLLTITSAAFLLNLWLHLRDPPRDRYGAFHRLLQLSAALILWTDWCYACLFAGKNGRYARDRAVVVAIVVAATTAAVVLSFLDGSMLTDRRKLHLRQRRESMVASHPEVFAQMLRPYFWPDGAINKVRAVTTWACVVSSKGCGLVAPLFLGWATTALAHADYRMTVYHSCAYCLVSFAGTTLKECQSLVYLKVAQAAFVQLSQVAFGHLHSLSLDWHLRKKLGEVLRSMDRGIAACDTLMKYLFLWLVPAFAECLTVVIIFAAYFDYLPLAMTVFYFVFAYVFLTIIVTLWRKKFRKALVKSDNEYHDIFTVNVFNCSVKGSLISFSNLLTYIHYLFLQKIRTRWSISKRSSTLPRRNSSGGGSPTP